jgi:hypothetical protein
MDNLPLFVYTVGDSKEGKAFGRWRFEVGGWRLEVGGWRLETKRPKTRSKLGLKAGKIDVEKVGR